MIRTGHVARTTAETDIDLTLTLEGSGKTSVSTGFGLLDHMLTLTAFWAGFDLTLTCRGDMHIDAHHSAEDIALCLGQALAQAVGDRKGIARVGFARVPMDEALAEVTLDISGRPWNGGATNCCRPCWRARSGISGANATRVSPRPPA